MDIFSLKSEKCVPHEYVIKNYKKNVISGCSGIMFLYTVKLCLGQGTF